MSKTQLLWFWKLPDWSCSDLFTCFSSVLFFLPSPLFLLCSFYNSSTWMKTVANTLFFLHFAKSFLFFSYFGRRGPWTDLKSSGQQIQRNLDFKSYSCGCKNFSWNTRIPELHETHKDPLVQPLAPPRTTPALFMRVVSKRSLNSSSLEPVPCPLPSGTEPFPGTQRDRWNEVWLYTEWESFKSYKVPSFCLTLWWLCGRKAWSVNWTYNQESNQWPCSLRSPGCEESSCRMIES